MVRIADIFKNVKDASPSSKKESGEKPAVTPKVDTPKENPKKPIVPLISEAIKSTQGNKLGIAERVYQEGFRLSKVILEKAKTGDTITGKEVQKAIDDMVAHGAVEISFARFNEMLLE